MTTFSPTPGLRFSPHPVMQVCYVTAIFGPRGSGKSLLMAEYGRLAHEAGKKVLYWPETYAFRYGEYVDIGSIISFDESMRGRILLIDEMQVLLSKWRTATTVSFEIRTFFQEVRKLGINVYYTTNAPDELDGELENQTNFHVECHKWEDPRCGSTVEQLHLADCHDTINTLVVDTQGVYGKSVGADGRSYRQRLRIDLINLNAKYHLYNTNAVADSSELRSLTRDAIMDRQRDARNGISAVELQTILREHYVPELVKDAREQIIPANYVNALNASETERLKRSVTLSSDDLTTALRTIGLEVRKRKGAEICFLPALENMEDWQDGLWSPF